MRIHGMMHGDTFVFSTLCAISLLGCSDPAVSVDDDAGTETLSMEGSTTGGPTTAGDVTSTGEPSSTGEPTGTSSGSESGSESSSGDVVVEPGGVLWEYAPADDIIDLVVDSDDSVYLLIDSDELSIEHVSARGALLETFDLAAAPVAPKGATGFNYGGQFITLLNGAPMAVSEYWYEEESGFSSFTRTQRVGGDPVDELGVTAEGYDVSGEGLVGAEFSEGAYGLFRLDANGQEVYRSEPESSVREVAARSGDGLFAMGSSWVYGYDGSGELSWTVQFEHNTIVELDRNLAIAPLSGGGVAVIRDVIDDPSELSSFARIFMISEEGEQTAQYDLPQIGWELEVDDANGFYVLRAPDDPTDSSTDVVKYDARAQQQWAVTIEGPTRPRLESSPSGALFVATDVLTRHVP